MYDSTVTRRHFLICGGGAIASARLLPAFAVGTAEIAPQPYFANVKRALEALAKLGSPVGTQDAQQLEALARQGDRAAVEQAEGILQRYTLATLSIAATGSVQIAVGGAPKQLVEQGWRMFLVRLMNVSGRTDKLNFGTGLGPPGASRMARGVHDFNLAQRGDLADTLNKAPLIEKMWLQSQLHDTTPMVRYGIEIPTTALSGVPIEYRVIQLFSRDSGPRREKLIAFTFPSPEGFRPSKPQQFDFECVPSHSIALGIFDDDGVGCVASLTIKDQQGHVYPPQAMRLAPDMYFQEQIYRADGETIRLPDGDYRIEIKRGPEYLVGAQTVKISDGQRRIDVKLKRWIDPARWGWYSGDAHIHAAGCAHYQNPTEGVSPETMIRQVRGEGLYLGEVLTWGPSWYYQKQFFSGKAISPPASLEHPELQSANNTSLTTHATPKDAESALRYDVEVSGFPSSHAGHLILLRLKDQDYPGTKLIEDWPSWNLPILKWGKEQGAVVGYAHCGSGMFVESTDLPNYEIPPMDGVGTQEGIVDVTHGALDFIAGCDTQPLAELNAWYHMLNCGYRLALIGETDYPCITGERPGVGRTYVRLDERPVDDAGYEAWVRAMQKGRLYCGDGRSHILELKVNGRHSGDGDIVLRKPSTVTIEALVAARLDPEQSAAFQETKDQAFNGWHLENARIGVSREVPVELVINGIAIEKVTLLADGTPRTIKFKTLIERSSWIALRILPSAHTHPVFVTVANKPIRASRRSAQWCRACVDKVWEVKSPFMRESERPAAAEAFDRARKTYDQIISECEVA